MAEHVLKTYYKDPSKTNSLGGLEKLRRSSKITSKELKEFAQSNENYQLFKPGRKKIARSRMIVRGYREIFSADCINYMNLSEYNDGFAHILVIIDNLSKYLWTFALKTLQSSEVVPKFESLFKQQIIPSKFHTDAGKELTSKKLRALFEELRIGHYVLGTDQKSFIAERVIKTIKTRIQRYFHSANTYKWYDILPQIVTSYNNSIHRSIQMKPIDVNPETELKALRNLYQDLEPTKDPKLEINDHVRIALSKPLIHKGYTQTYSNEIFKIIHVFLNRFPYPMYRISSLQGDEIKGSFYASEMQKVKFEENGLYKIDEILDKKTVRGKTKVLVSFKGWDKSHNTWMNITDLELIE